MGSPIAWDNVPVDDHDLGYVVANHGDGLERRGASGELGKSRPHVITYYRSLGDSAESLPGIRAELLTKTPEQLREEVLNALEPTHPEFLALKAALARAAAAPGPALIDVVIEGKA